MIGKRPLLVFCALLLSAAAGCATARPNQTERLGKLLFFDTRLSTPPGQSCAACHMPEAGWTGPDSKINAAGAVYPGAVHTRFGNRKPPSAAYAAASPVLHYDKEEKHFVGGNFWDGRATGEILGNPAADQSMGPFLNPVEQNNPDEKAVVDKVCTSEYANLFRDVYGKRICGDVTKAYRAIALAIAAFEASSEVNPFSSKFDVFYENSRKAGLDVEDIDERNRKDFGGLGLDDGELEGLALFNTRGKCSACHVLEPGPGGTPPLFTDFTYDNLGFPRNGRNPWYGMPAGFNPEGAQWVDKGLGGFLATRKDWEGHADANMGKHKVPTLRNVDRKSSPDLGKAYGHNGYFKSLKEIVRFYNRRDGKPAAWPPPEVEKNVNTAELGDLRLTDREEDAIVAFLKTLTDGTMRR